MSNGFDNLSREQLLEIIEGYQREFDKVAEVFDMQDTIGGEPLSDYVNRKVKWLVTTLETVLAVMEKAELDLSVTPIEMTEAQYEDLTLRVADDVGDCAANTKRIASLAGLDLSLSNNKIRSG